MSKATFQALLDDETFDLILDGGTLQVNEATLPVSFEATGPAEYSLLLDGQSVPVVVTPAGPPKTYDVTAAGHTWTVRVKDERDLLLERFGLDEALGAGEIAIRAPMPGLVLEVRVAVGDTVAVDEGLLVLEAMKMENELKAPAEGQVKAIHVVSGDAVGKNELLIEFEA